MADDLHLLDATVQLIKRNATRIQAASLNHAFGYHIVCRLFGNEWLRLICLFKHWRR